jgi:hypothetical protein
MTTMTVSQLLAATCPHGAQLGKCQELWCRSRAEDLLTGDYPANLPDVTP